MPSTPKTISREVDKKKEKMSKIAKTIKKVDDGRRELIESVQENADEETKEGATLSTMLDMLSIGHWTEKLGGAIGEAIKPTTITSVEDMENKALYESKKNEIIADSNRLSAELYDLKCQLNEVDDFGRQHRLENSIKEKNRALEDKKRELEEMKLRAEKRNVADQVKHHLEIQFDEFEQAQYKKGLSLIQAILNKAKIDIIETLNYDYYEKLSYYEETIKELQNVSLSETVELVECGEKIAQLRQSISDVGMWFE